MRAPVKRRTHGEPNLAGLGRAISGFFSGRMISDSPEWEAMQNDMARIQGRRAYYQGSPSSPEVKRKVAIKMGSR